MADSILITGLNGTVAPVVAQALQRDGSKVVGWDRNKVPETDFASSAEFLDQCQPQKIYHIGLGPPEWAAVIASWCRDNDRPFLFTSTASVFAGCPERPYTIDDQPDATDDYGRYKYDCEQAVLTANPNALIVRLGWQIGDGPGSNNMVDYFETKAADGILELSTNWFPACSFLEDTADALLELESRGERGVFHLDGNPGLSIFEIGKRLSELHANRWQVQAASEPRYYNLMRDARVPVAPITRKLPQERAR